MKKLFALLVLAACALPVAVSAQSATDPAKMVQVFSNAVKIDGATLQIVLLNDRTVEALFPQSPAKAALRTKGRMTTVFFISGSVTKDLTFDPAVKVEQKGKTFDGKSSSMKNFAA